MEIREVAVNIDVDEGRIRLDTSVPGAVSRELAGFSKKGRLGPYRSFEAPLSMETLISLTAYLKSLPLEKQENMPQKSREFGGDLEHVSK